MYIRAGLQPGRGHQRGFTLIELMIVVAIIAVLTIVAIASYDWAVTKTRRKQAAACAETGAQWMERFYTANLRYDQDSAGVAVTTTFPPTNSLCPSGSQISTYYTVAIAAKTATTYSITATPKGIQLKRDTACKVLAIDQKGAKTDSGTSAPASCW
ncbi:MAG TPA: type IV pilin protein [Xanthomonadaceae bacterium]